MFSILHDVALDVQAQDGRGPSPRASSGLLASFTPPALPRPPVLTWAFTTTRPPIFSAAARASSGVVTTSPTVVRTPCLAKTVFAWYSIKSTTVVPLSHLFE